MAADQIWEIIDLEVITFLRDNGFTCEHPQTTITPGSLQIFTRHPDEDKDWYVTSCPITFNGQYTLPDGHIIESSGTRLILAFTAK